MELNIITIHFIALVENREDYFRFAQSSIAYGFRVLGFHLDDHPNALADAEACAHIAINVFR